MNVYNYDDLLNVPTKLHFVRFNKELGYGTRCVRTNMLQVNFC
jgi:hypothetical protein